MHDRSNHIVEVPLHAVAHARTGDKGNRINISVIPYDDTVFEALREQITEEKVRELFAHRGAGEVAIYSLPRLPALNIVIDDVLQGGVNGSLNLDGHGKSLAFRLLEMVVHVPSRLVVHERYIDWT